MLCSNSHISLIAKLLCELNLAGEYNNSPVRTAYDLACQNTAANGQGVHGRDFVYHDQLDLASVSKKQLFSDLKAYQEACVTYPGWKSSPAKAATDAAMAAIAKACMTDLPPSQFPYDSPSSTLDITQVIPHRVNARRM